MRNRTLKIAAASVLASILFILFAGMDGCGPQICTDPDECRDAPAMGMHAF